jgi:hypothetical protein
MFSATAGTAYTIETFDESSGLDTVLTLYAPDGSGGLTQVAYNDDYTGSFYSRIEYTPSVNETLYVEITELGGATGNYGFEIY